MTKLNKYPLCYVISTLIPGHKKFNLRSAITGPRATLWRRLHKHNICCCSTQCVKAYFPRETCFNVHF